MDAFSGLAVLFGLLGLALGVVGFIIGLGSGAHAMTWLWGVVVSSMIGPAWDFEAEHRALVAAGEVPLAETSASRMGRTPPVGS